MANKVQFTERQKKIQAVASTTLIIAVVAVIVALIIKFIIWLFS